MGLRKGKTNNPKGRPKGAQNKMTSELKDWIRQIIDGNRGKFEADLKSLEPKDRLMIVERLMQYVVPKQQSISVEAQIQAEYDALEMMLGNMPDEAINKLAERVIELNRLNKQENE